MTPPPNPVYALSIPSAKEGGIYCNYKFSSCYSITVQYQGLGFRAKRKNFFYKKKEKSQKIEMTYLVFVQLKGGEQRRSRETNKENINFPKELKNANKVNFLP